MNLKLSTLSSLLRRKVKEISGVADNEPTKYFSCCSAEAKPWLSILNLVVGIKKYLIQYL